MSELPLHRDFPEPEPTKTGPAALFPDGIPEELAQAFAEATQPEPLTVEDRRGDVRTFANHIMSTAGQSLEGIMANVEACEFSLDILADLVEHLLEHVDVHAEGTSPLATYVNRVEEQYPAGLPEGGDNAEHVHQVLNKIFFELTDSKLQFELKDFKHADG